jgi:hypothetical protein
MSDTLNLPLKGEYFDQILLGAKTEEYRLVTPFWSKRLSSRSYEYIRLTRGYPKRGDPDRTLVLPWKGCEVKTINHPHFGPDDVQVFAINVGP